ncbi:sensor histidine kinase [Colwellia piezophila]|uniref:sensor histidine kinase n=1 Tax=Colwellia piezophila TaxID=211668 RepID=UPI000371DD56|nr:ATP-binding protein [Colwellia piezophila]
MFTGPFEKRIFTTVLWAILPSYFLALFLLWYIDSSFYLQALVTIFLSAMVGFSFHHFYYDIKDQFISLANLIEALNIGDFSLRGKAEVGQSGHSDLIRQVNKLADSLTTARYDFKESQLLLAKVIKQIKVAIIACDQQGKITMVNPETELLLGLNESKLRHKTLADVNLGQLSELSSNSIEKLTFGSRTARWHIFKDGFRDQGKQHSLYIFSDLDLLLSQQEQEAWKNLVRVLSHEINNSLAPIISLASTLDKLTARSDIEREDKEDIQLGLKVIQDRATSLKHFLAGYRVLTHLPKPKLQSVDIIPVIEQLVSLLNYPVNLSLPSKMELLIDVAQFEQCLINLLKNAHEASEKNSEIDLLIKVKANQVLLYILDKGPGIQNLDNIFVPLFTTKAEGTGIGLSLCKQIIEGHQGQLRLSNRAEGGCQVEINLPR